MKTQNKTRMFLARYDISHYVTQYEHLIYFMRI
jgi:hypothetical protein